LVAQGGPAFCSVGHDAYKIMPAVFTSRAPITRS